MARYLALCGETLIEYIGVSSMNYAELRSKAEQYFRASLAKGKLRRSEQGPFSNEEKERMEQSIELRDMPNKDYWDLIGQANTTNEFKRFCEA